MYIDSSVLIYHNASVNHDSPTFQVTTCIFVVYTATSSLRAKIDMQISLLYHTNETSVTVFLKQNLGTKSLPMINVF